MGLGTTYTGMGRVGLCRGTVGAARLACDKSTRLPDAVMSAATCAAAAGACTEAAAVVAELLPYLPVLLPKGAAP